MKNAWKIARLLFQDESRGSCSSAASGHYAITAKKPAVDRRLAGPEIGPVNYIPDQTVF
jgi:hypothetical protein